MVRTTDCPAEPRAVCTVAPRRAAGVRGEDEPDRDRRQRGDQCGSHPPAGLRAHQEPARLRLHGAIASWALSAIASCLVLLTTHHALNVPEAFPDWERHRA
jgi:hypothetical protein